MFIGHFAVGLAAARVEKRLPLGTAFIAAQLPDALWPVFLAVGLERVTIAPGDTAMTPLRFDSYPWSHSLLMVCVWAALAALVFRVASGATRAAGFIAAAAISHWVLDFVTHREDMPLSPWSDTRVGLGLWKSVPLTVTIEGAMFIAAVALYAHGRVLPRSFWALIGVLLIVYAANVLGPPPPSVNAIVGSMVLLIPLIWWWGNRAGRPVAAV